MRSSRRTALLLILALGCGGSTPKLKDDFSANFAGLWTGTVTTTGLGSQSVRPVSIFCTISAGGFNRLVLPGLEPTGDWLVADVLSSTVFAVEPRQTTLSNGSTMSVTGARGLLQGAHLSYEVQGTLRAPGGDPGLSSDFWVVYDLDRRKGPPAPATLTAAYGDDYRTVQLAWAASAGAVLYTAEFRVDSGDWQQIPAGTQTWSTSITVHPSGNIPELATMAFHVLAYDNFGLVSAPSPEATLVEPPLGATAVSARQSGDAVEVSWTTLSQKADTVVIERGVRAPLTGTVATWVPLASLPFSQTSYLDSTVAEGTDYAFSVTMASGQNRSYAVWATVKTAIRTPVDLRAIPGFKKVSLAWTNRSASATGLAVLRSRDVDAMDLQPIAQLSASATSYDDTSVDTDWYTYGIEVQVATNKATSNSVTVMTLPDSSNLSLVPSIPGLPAADFAQRDSHGGWVLGGAYLWWNPIVYVQSGSGDWKSYYPTGQIQWAPPYFLLDDQDRPQFMYLWGADLNGQPYDILRAWYDGSALQEEQVANRTLASSQASSVGFAVDGTGKMHAFWAYLAGGNGTIAFEYASNSTGSWVIEQLPDWSVQFNSPNSVLLNVDPAGGLHALVNQGTALAHAERPAGGMWLWELVSTDDGSGETSYFFGDSVQCASPVAGDFRVFFSQTKSNNTVYELVEAHKANGAWLAPQVVMTQPNHGSDGLQIAVRSDGLRQAARIRSSDGDALYVDDGAGWKRTLVGPELRGAPALGFKPDGSLYLLEHAPSPVEWVLYEEH